MKCQTEIHYSKEVVSNGENDGPSFMVSCFEIQISDSSASQDKASRTVCILAKKLMLGLRSSTTSTIFLHWRRTPKFKICHQYRNPVTNIHKLSLTLRRQHHDVTNITVTA